MLTEEIVQNSVLTGGVCLGGLIFELADEWWKDGEGDHTQQDVGGVAPGAGPYPDSVFNEEWWGLVKIDRTPRKAFNAFRDVAMPIVPGAPASAPAADLPHDLPVLCKTVEEGSLC